MEVKAIDWANIKVMISVNKNKYNIVDRKKKPRKD